MAVELDHDAHPDRDGHQAIRNCDDAGPR